MSTRADRPNHPELYGLSFEELIRAALEEVRGVAGHSDSDWDLLQYVENCLEEMLWRQTVKPEPVVVPTGSFGTTKAYPLTTEE